MMKSWRWSEWTRSCFKSATSAGRKWKQLAENCAKYIGKGSMVAVDGRLQIRSYEDKDGNRRTIAEVVAENVQFLDSRKKDGGGGSTGPEAAAKVFDEHTISEDDVPF